MGAGKLRTLLCSLEQAQQLPQAGLHVQKQSLQAKTAQARVGPVLQDRVPGPLCSACQPQLLLCGACKLSLSTWRGFRLRASSGRQAMAACCMLCAIDRGRCRRSNLSHLVVRKQTSTWRGSWLGVLSGKPLSLGDEPWLLCYIVRRQCSR